MRLIDADELMTEVCNKVASHGDKRSYRQIVEEMPAVDAVPVIRCKDCEHWQCDEYESYCDELGIFNTDMNSYCSYAKKGKK